jgi:hypothetical protein
MRFLNSRRSGVVTMLTVKHERGEMEGRKTGKSTSVKIDQYSVLFVIFALMALGFGVYRFVHTEFSKGSLSTLVGIVVPNFALHWMGVFGD